MPGVPVLHGPDGVGEEPRAFLQFLRSGQGLALRGMEPCPSAGPRRNPTHATLQPCDVNGIRLESSVYN